MTEQRSNARVERRLAIIRHAQEVTGNVAMTCRYYGISRQTSITSGSAATRSSARRACGTAPGAR